MSTTDTDSLDCSGQKTNEIRIQSATWAKTIETDSE